MKLCFLSILFSKGISASFHFTVYMNSASTSLSSVRSTRDWDPYEPRFESHGLYCRKHRIGYAWKRKYLYSLGSTLPSFSTFPMKPQIGKSSLFHNTFRSNSPTFRKWATSSLDSFLLQATSVSLSLLKSSLEGALTSRSPFKT